MVTSSTSQTHKFTCLFANTSNTASLSSSSASIRISSSFASPTRSLSLLSTTKMRPESKVKRVSFEGNHELILIHQHGKDINYLTLCVLEVMPPKRPDLVLTADIPHCKTDVFVFYRLNVKT